MMLLIFFVLRKLNTRGYSLDNYEQLFALKETMINKFNPGTIVKFNLDSPNMTVIRRLPNASGDSVVACQWCVGTKIMEGSFDENLLIKVDQLSQVEVLSHIKNACTAAIQMKNSAQQLLSGIAAIHKVDMVHIPFSFKHFFDINYN